MHDTLLQKLSFHESGQHVIDVSTCDWIVAIGMNKQPVLAQFLDDNLHLKQYFETTTHKASGSPPLYEFKQFQFCTILGVKKS